MLELRDIAEVEQAFCDAARIRAAFRQGMAEPHLDWYHLPRAEWPVPGSQGRAG